MRFSYQEMCRAVGVKKPEEAPKARALWKMKAAKDAGEEYYDPRREDNIQGRSETRSALWEEHLKDPIVALDKALKCVEIFFRGLGPSARQKGVSQWRALASSKVCGKSRSGRAFLPYLDPLDSVCLRTESAEWHAAGKCGPHGELSFFLIQKELATEPVGETFSPFFNADIRTPLFSADVLEKCAVLALHIICGRRKRR